MKNEDTKLNDKINELIPDSFGSSQLHEYSYQKGLMRPRNKLVLWGLIFISIPTIISCVVALVLFCKFQNFKEFAICLPIILVVLGILVLAIIVPIKAIVNYKKYRDVINKQDEHIDAQEM